MFGDTVLSERRTVAALADLLLGGYDVAHPGSPILLSYVHMWFVALGYLFGNCWFVACGSWLMVTVGSWLMETRGCCA